MNWLPAAICFYLAFGAILWLGLDDAELDRWDEAAVKRFTSRMRPGDVLLGRNARILASLVASMVGWPFLGLRK